VQEPESEYAHVVLELQKKYVRSRLRDITEGLRKTPGNGALLEQQRELSAELRRLITGQG